MISEGFVAPGLQNKSLQNLYSKENQTCREPVKPTNPRDPGV